MRLIIMIYAAIFALAGCGGGGGEAVPAAGTSPPPSDGSPPAAIGQNPGDFLRANFSRDGFERSSSGSSLTRITAANAPSGQAKLQGIANLEGSGIYSGTLISGDASLDVDFGAGTLAGRAERFAVYAVPGFTYDAQYQGKRGIDGTLTLSGTLSQQTTSLTGRLRAQGKLTDTASGSDAIGLGLLSADMRGAIVRNPHTGGKLFGLFTDTSRVQARAADGSISPIGFEAAVLVSE